ncbi:hypothetical protein [Xanthomonas hortorum]|uniref:Secreted protein n=1 Tax=Xanthomonas hortorum pv. gardneri TaxID=2754056 RepID=A0A6V7DZT0_9XANT|nr:hypothetical protein [Xanthomonas hortorum]MCC4626072.1 hypothetical protein [Xanthomonas campestris pv. nigromaculans]APP80058.1 hypothetical protein BJD10_10390 [Xanthomonas hortorum pv. gardneri]EGD16817.1 hypothetical protein XGA_4614 [Xanthomonas hortorum ATCC 19865]KLA97369.1 hypothetical protein SM18210_19110 [Xanthomonas hortorum pv. gardneri]KLA99903.1 hypothetical protein SM17710_08475 [Xanthomonas hortorum pv. gardneri]
MKTVLSIFGSVILLGAVASASADDFTEQRANAQGFWDQQVQCVDSSDWGATATCLGNVWNTYF